MLEVVVVLLGMCLFFIPVLLYVRYLFARIKEEQNFDLHLKKVKENVGSRGVIIAYLNKISFGVMVFTLGLYLSSYFENEVAIRLFIVFTLFYFVTRYFDQKNEI